MALSPASSPRLPSPPPIAEDQIGPTSPGMPAIEDHGKLLGASGIDFGASRRIRPGTRAENMAEGPPLVELQDIDSAFQLTEHLKALYYANTNPPDSDTTLAVTAELARQLAQPPPNTSKEIWLYELGRFLIQKTNAIIVALFSDSPPCNPQTCPEMRASEWQYLCAVHDPPKSCSAIDYCCHTLDWAATSLTSSKMFPSRLGLGSGHTTGAIVGGPNSDKVLQQQMKEITNIFRRVYRIYAHAWFQHREMFWRVEAKTGLYIFFKTICDEYGMIQPENYTIPPEAEGIEAATPQVEKDMPEAPSLLRRDPDASYSDKPDPVGSMNLISGETTKRHRHSHSDVSSYASHPIQEELEEEEDRLSGVPAATSLPEPEGDTNSTDSSPMSEKLTLPTVGHNAPSELTIDSVKGSNDEGDETVLEVLPTSELHEPSEPDEVEVMDPETSEAADADEAGKTVAD